MSLSNTVKTIQDIMRKDAGVDGDAQRIGQLGWMLFLKIYSDLELETELEDTKYKSPIPKKYRWESWADESVAGKDSFTGDALINFINNDLFPKLKELDLSSFNGQARERGALLISVFDDAYNYMKNGTLLRQVINKINQDIDYNSVETRHLFGDIYEQILRDLQNAGNAGEYYTPRAVTQFAIEMVNPQLGEIVLDPACGTGGFLTGAFEHMKKQVKKPAELKALKNSIRGVEKKPLPHVLCATNMMVHGIEVPSNIINGNTLAKPLRDYGRNDQVDVVVTNPPFGGVEEDGIENNFPAEFRTRETADLFLVLVMELLKDGGRAAILLPDGTLSGEGIKTKIKKKMLEELNLHTIIRLPKSVFAPYTNIASNILFLTKGEPTKDIWYFEHKLPLGVKSYNKTKPMRLEEFDVEKSWWLDRQENEQAWKVSIEQVTANNFNLDIKNPNAPLQIHENPELLLKDYLEISEHLNPLQESIKASLSRSLPQNEISNILIKNINLITGSTNGVNRLRKLIVSIAVAGNLVEQKSDEGNAVEALTSLDLTQVREVLSINQNSETELPLGWAKASFPNIGNWVGGNGFPTSEQGHVGREILFCKVSDMNLERNSRYIEETVNSIDEKSAKRLRINVHSAGTVIFPKIGGAIATNKRRILVQPTAIDNNCMGIKPSDAIFTEWLFLLLTSIDFTKYQSGTSIPSISQKTLDQISFGVPPYKEQERIVSRVNELMALCDELESEIQKSRVLADAFADSIVSSIS
jgi:type I restriction enzyme M protein